MKVTLAITGDELTMLVMAVDELAATRAAALQRIEGGGRTPRDLVDVLRAEIQKLRGLSGVLHNER